MCLRIDSAQSQFVADAEIDGSSSIDVEVLILAFQYAWRADGSAIDKLYCLLSCATLKRLWNMPNAHTYSF